MHTEKLEELSAELQTIEEDILPDLRSSLFELTKPDYDPEQNSDDELREQDIEYYQSEISINERRAATIRAKLARSKPS